MAGSSNPQPKKPTPPRPAENSPRKPLQVMHISKKGGKEVSNDEKSKESKGNDLDPNKEKLPQVVSNINFPPRPPARQSSLKEE